MEELYFEPLNKIHFSFIHDWYNKPHVQAFYSLRDWTSEEVQKKLTPYLNDENPMNCFVVYHSGQPIGYIQSYPLKDYPWENQDLPKIIEENAAGIDFFIADENYLGKGIGFQIINNFLEQFIWPFYQYCMADPDIRNDASIRLLKKCGFIEHKKIQCKDALKREVSLCLFIKMR